MDTVVDSKYMLSYAGEHNMGVSCCLNCGFYPEPIFDHIKGFYDSPIGLLFVAECPKCFEIWSAHADKYHYYDYFLDSVEAGTNVHFKESPHESI